MFDPQDVAAAVDVLGADVEGFAHPQAAVVDEGEVGLVAVVAEGGQEFGDLLAGEDGTGEFALVLKVGEEGENLAAVEIQKRDARVVIGELGGPAEVGFY